MGTLYVNTASTPGGNGTTNATDGADPNRACACLNDAEALLPADITTGGDQGVWTIICEGTTADTTAVTFAGTTTSATYYIEAKAVSSASAGRHDGKWNTGKYRLQVSNAAAITIADAYMRFEGLQVWVSAINNNSQSAFSIGDDVGVDLRFTACILRGANDTETVYSYHWGIYKPPSNSSSVTVRNCLVYDFRASTAVEKYAIGIGINNSNLTCTVHNCTIVNCNKGLYRANGTLNATNCGIADCLTATSGTISLTTCSSSTPTFVDGANDNFHLASGDTTWKDQGTDLSATFTDDIDEQTRSGSWDIGCDEYVASGYRSPLPAFRRPS